MSKKFYITTPIYYPSGEPHLGHCYTTLACDTIARYHRLAGDDTFFLTGTDEHGIKMVKAATEQRVEPKVLADRLAGVFRDFWDELQVTNDDFIRTTDERHRIAVQQIVNRLHDNGDIYLGTYEGWYDEGQEEFVTETEAKANDYKSSVSGRPLIRYTEKSYFFQLSKYVPQVLEHIQHNPEFIQPDSRRNEVLSKLRAGVGDLSISRSTLSWGIPVPFDTSHVVYVWIDALTNYISALDYGTKHDTKFRTYWPADVHVIGKEIMWFHTVYWPAMLLSLGLPLPKQVFAHGWWTAEGKKMSKSMGNFIDLERIRGVIQTYSLDALRYYLLRAAPFGSDLDWGDADFVKSFNELANVVGNCLNRTVKMIGRYREGRLPPAAGPLEAIDRNLIEQTNRLGEQVRQAYEKLQLQQCVLLPVELARATNGYIDATQPFSLAKDLDKADRLNTVLNLSAQAIYRALVCLMPALPEKAVQGLRQLGVTIVGRKLDDFLANPLPDGHRIGEGEPLFPKVQP